MLEFSSLADRVLSVLKILRVHPVVLFGKELAIQQPKRKFVFGNVFSRIAPLSVLRSDVKEFSADIYCGLND